MVETKTPTVRKALTLSVKDFEYLERLAGRGIHGSEWTGVARNFIEEGIRKAIINGFIKQDDD